MVWPTVHQSGTVYYNPQKAYNGYTLWCPLADGDAEEAGERPGSINLITMEGKVVHTWETPFPTFLSRLLPDGHMAAMVRCTAGDHPERNGLYHMGGGGGILMEYDWDGNVVFEHKDPFMHHDFRKLPNGHYIYVGWEKVPPDLAKKVRGGQAGTEHFDGTMFCDYFREIDTRGDTVWEWHGFEHFDPDVDIIGPIHPRCEWTHINDMDVLPDGNILSDSRHTDGAFIVERKTGNIIWRWGNTAYLNRETGQVELMDTGDPKTMGGPHAAYCIEEGLPGAGNMLVYDNAMYTYVSRALEVDINTGEIVWESQPRDYSYGRVHFSPFISNATRLPNGNTLICEGQNGVFIEITRNQEMVWQWVLPEPMHKQEHVKWGIYRAYRYSPDYCPQMESLDPAEGKEILPEGRTDVTWK